MAKRILLVEDTPSLVTVYEAYLKKSGHDVVHVDTCSGARRAMNENAFDLVLLDLSLPDGDGLEILSEAKSKNVETPFIVITANASINRAVVAMRAGAFDFLVKPFAEPRLTTAVGSALERSIAAREVAPPPAHGAKRTFFNFIGASGPMQGIYDSIASVAPSNATVFITGESGTGKEVCAEALHSASKRASGPFVALNCGAIPSELLESEVFGHLKGSFTGAIADRKGAAERANGGTLFLDEICEMEPLLQTKLLRFLQSSMIQPVGAGQPKRVNVRIVCATNRDPAAEVAAGRFREDLFYRLHVIPVHMPPLRERGADILEIANALLKRFAKEEGKKLDGFSADAQRALLQHDWPGNVRELQNVVRQVAVMTPDGVVGAASLPELRARQRPAPIEPDAAAPVLATPDASRAPASAFAPPVAVAPCAAGPVLDVNPYVGKTLETIEREAIEATIEMYSGSIPKAAKALGVSPSTIYRKREAWISKTSQGEETSPIEGS